jgi:hypothetical protein
MNEVSFVSSDRVSKTKDDEVSLYKWDLGAQELHVNGYNTGDFEVDRAKGKAKRGYEKIW